MGVTDDAHGFADVPIDRIVVFEGDQTEFGSSEIYHGDDVVFSTIPEPSARVLGLAGAVAFAFAARRRRK